MKTDNPVAILRNIRDGDDGYKGIFIWCPGCEYTVHDEGIKVGGLHLLPISGNSKRRPTWTWNGSVVKVSLSPSILTRTDRGDVPFVCHSFLENGYWRFLGDCTHSLVGQTVPMLPLPDWLVHDQDLL